VYGALTPTGDAAMRLPPLLRTSALLLGLALLAGCAFRPSEAAMRQAITTHVAAAEDYPMAFMTSDNFRFRDLQRVADAEKTTYSVHADFDFVYTADGATIVAALKEKARADQDKDKRRADTVFEKLALAAAGALQRHGTEQRFESVKVGDKDSYQGEFTFVRNDDGSWRVADADHR
jgi:hypothetical protein